MKEISILLFETYYIKRLINYNFLLSAEHNIKLFAVNTLYLPFIIDKHFFFSILLFVCRLKIGENDLNFIWKLKCFLNRYQKQIFHQIATFNELQRVTNVMNYVSS